MSRARLLEPDWPWAKRPLEELPLGSKEVMISIAVAYLVVIAIGNQLMKGRKVD